jgi:hypothetical protein
VCSSDLTIYRAKPGIAPALTQPNLTAPVRWPALQGIIPAVAKNNGTWVWLNTDESSLFVDNGTTYANTYYFAIWGVSTKFRPVFCYDDQWPDGPGGDESDSYMNWGTPLYLRYDFFLNVSVIRYPYPSNVVLRVNGSPVRDISRQPGKGVWENWPSPAINMTGATRLYDVTSTAPTLFFNVSWFGSLYSTKTADTISTIWTNRPTVDWQIQFNTTFPAGSSGRVILVSIETDWDVVVVHYNGVPFSGWRKEVGYMRITDAKNGSWLILCRAPDYVINAQVLNSLGEVVTAANASDQVTVRGRLHDSYGINATTGWAYFLVYDHYDSLTYVDNLSIVPPGGIADFSWWIWEWGTGAGNYSFQVLWTNGTEAGMQVTGLTVYSGTYLVVTYEYPASSTEPIIRGDTVIIEVYYYYDEFMSTYPVDNAMVDVYNDSSGLLWDTYDWYNWAGSGYPGYYTAYLATDFATPNVFQNVTMQISAEFSEGQAYSKQFYIKTKMTQIVFFWNGYPLPGLTNTSPTDWRTSPEPYLNDSSLQFTVMYTDESGFPLPGAQLSPFIVVNGTAEYKRLNWIDLSEIDSTSAGLYNITVDTNQIGSVTLHEGDM